MGLFPSSLLLLSIKGDFSLLLLKEFPPLIQGQNFSFPLIGAVRKRKSLGGSGGGAWKQRKKVTTAAFIGVKQDLGRAEPTLGWGMLLCPGSSGSGGDGEADGELCPDMS